MTEIRRTVAGEQVLQVFSYFPDLITVDGVIVSQSYTVKREDFAWINFDNPQTILDQTSDL